MERHFLRIYLSMSNLYTSQKSFISIFIHELVQGDNSRVPISFLGHFNFPPSLNNLVLNFVKHKPAAVKATYPFFSLCGYLLEHHNLML